MTIAFISSLSYTHFVKNYLRYCHMKVHNPTNCFNFDQNTFAEVFQQCGIRSKAPSPKKLVYLFWSLLFSKENNSLIETTEKNKSQSQSGSLLYTVYWIGHLLRPRKK